MVFIALVKIQCVCVCVCIHECECMCVHLAYISECVQDDFSAEGRGEGGDEIAHMICDMRSSIVNTHWPGPWPQ